MALRPGTHKVDGGSLRVNTYRQGVAQKVGHDLIIDVGDWNATVSVGDDGAVATIALEADPRSLQVLEGLHGAKPLTDKDRADIRSTIAARILGGGPISFFSDSVEERDGGITAHGRLSLAGATRPVTFQVDVGDDGRIGGTLLVTQSDWGIKPYRAFMGALKVRDTVEVVVDARLPAG
jgi:hypothetical protein